jgi:hypothetical protein
MPANVMRDPIKKKGSENSNADLLRVNKLANRAKSNITKGMAYLPSTWLNKKLPHSFVPENTSSTFIYIHKAE